MVWLPRFRLRMRIGAAMTGVLVLGLGWTCLWMFRVGYKIKT